GGVPGLHQQHVLRRAAAAQHGRLLRRPDLWRQPRQGGLEDGGLSGPTGHLPGGVPDLSGKEVRQAAALDRRFFVSAAFVFAWHGVSLPRPVGERVGWGAPKLKNLVGYLRKEANRAAAQRSSALTQDNRGRNPLTPTL